VRHQAQALGEGGGDADAEDIVGRPAPVGGPADLLAELPVGARRVANGGSLMGQREERPLHERHPNHHGDCRQNPAPPSAKDQDDGNHQEDEETG
jgi:hypothetical protein